MKFFGFSKLLWLYLIIFLFWVFLGFVFINWEKKQEKSIHILTRCIVVNGVEYAFGAHEYSSTGIFEGEPKQCDGFTFRKTILIGKTDMGPAEVRAVIEELAEVYRGNAYNLITKNCNHFCNDACIRLTGNPIPSWVNRLARIGKSRFQRLILLSFLFFAQHFHVMLCYYKKECIIRDCWLCFWHIAIHV